MSRKETPEGDGMGRGEGLKTIGESLQIDIFLFTTQYFVINEIKSTKCCGKDVPIIVKVLAYCQPQKVLFFKKSTLP